VGALANSVMFLPTLGGTTDWTYSSAVNGFQSPSLGGLVNGSTYTYRAESLDLTQWEVGVGVYNSGTGVLTRAYVMYNSAGTGVGVGQSGAGSKISFTVAPNVGIVASAEDLGMSFVITGIDKSGGTDVGAKINAFIQATPAYSRIILPVGLYFTTVTIVVDNGRTLIGASGGYIAATTPTSGACIQGNLTVTPIVKCDGGAGSQSCSVKNLNISRIAGSFASTVIALQLNAVNNATFADLFISRSGTGIDLLDGNVTIRFEHITIHYVNFFYVAMHATAVEISWNMCRFGINGGVDVACTGYVFMDGGGWDTIRFDNCQWNTSIGGGVQHGVYFNAYNAANPNGIFRISLLHAEGMSATFMVMVGCTALIPRVAIHNSQINSPGVTFTTATQFNEMSIVGTDINMNVGFTTLHNSRFVGNLVSGTFAIDTSNGCTISGNRFYSSVTITGVCTRTNVVANSIDGTITDTASGTGYLRANNSN
jgi:hypothetical protein